MKVMQRWRKGIALGLSSREMESVLGVDLTSCSRCDVPHFGVSHRGQVDGFESPSLLHLLYEERS